MMKAPPGFFQLRIRPWSLLTAAGVVACTATLFGFLGRYSWLLDLFSHFRVQYLLGLSTIGLILLIARRWKVAAGFLGFACVNLIFIAPMYFGGRPVPPEATPPLRAMLLNVNTQSGDADRVRTVIEDNDPDILVLQEISGRWMNDLAWLKNSHPHTLAQPREDNFGIGLFSKFPLVDSEVAYIGKVEVPSLLATVRTSYTDLRVVATHPLPPGSGDYSRKRNQQLDRLPDYVRSTLPVLLLGDLNVTPWNYHFRKLLVRTGLRDSARGFGVQPTWPNFNPLFRIPLDHGLHSEDIYISGRKIGESVLSDHYPLIIDFAIVPYRNAKN